MRRAAEWVVFLVLAPGMALGVGPWAVLDRGWGGRVDPGGWRVFGWPVLAAGVGLMLWCWWDFATRGRGTPAPFAPTHHLVVSGPYQLVRNPMYVAGVTFLIGLATVTGAPALLGYAVAFWILCAAFVRWYEEPTLARMFGAEYARYRARVPGWVPGLRTRTVTPTPGEDA